MEIVTLLKANIRHKKGAFLSIILLMSMISTALMLILSVWNNIYGGIQDAQQRKDVGNMLCIVDGYTLNHELLSKVENHPLVQKIKEEEVLAAWKVIYDDTDYGNPVYIRELSSDNRLLRPQGTGFLQEIPKLKPGEIYIPQGLKTNFSCDIGDTLKIVFAKQTYDFRIMGVIEEPELGASVIGWKNVFIGHEDFVNIYTELEQVSKAQGEFSGVGVQLSIYKKDSCNLTDAKFARQVNLDTGIADMSSGVITRELMLKYTSLFPQIICTILMVFVMLLLAAVIVIMCHSVSTGIEMEYVTFGIMKSQGFVTRKIQLILLIQYLSAEWMGAIFGLLAGIPLCRTFGNVFYPITGIIPRNDLAIEKCCGILLGVFAVSAFSVVLITRKIAKISPVRAIAGGAKGIYFESRVQCPVSQRMLSASLGLRQFTSNKKQYVGVTCIVTILVYFMVTMMVLTNVITATSAWETMGIEYADLDIEFVEGASELEIQNVERTIRKTSEFRISYRSCGNYYMSVEGEQMMACIYDGAEYVKAISKGRAPFYKNEVVMTEIAAQNLGLKIGDTVTIAFRDKKAQYMISGLNQHMNDAGINFSMTKDAAEKLGTMTVRYLGYILEDKFQGEQIEVDLNQEYGELLTVGYHNNVMDESYQLAIQAMTLIVYGFSILFAMIVIHMVCSKAFVRERRDIGIYKALGFTSKKLRLQFAVRFSIVAILGALFGSGFAAVFVGDMLSVILRAVGISSFQVTFSVATFVVPAMVICACFFFFAFAASRKIKVVEVRELVY